MECSALDCYYYFVVIALTMEVNADAAVAGVT